MTLWDLLEAAQYEQVFSIYTHNAYDQNFPIARGTRSEMMAIDAEGEGELFEHLMHKIENYMFNKNGLMVIFLRDEKYNSRADEYYSAEIAKRWNNLDPDTRPWLYRTETEAYTDKYIGKFPALSD